jgi:hypothetical protein
MIQQTDYTVSVDKLQESLSQLPNFDFRTAINKPAGNFFYDAWVLKDEFIGTVWEDVYNSLPVNKGEARIINLNPATCYQIHADIDDRYHLNLSGEACYLLDFDKNELHKLSTDGTWYDMDAGRLHSASNFGRLIRTQLVVRKLLTRNNLSDPVTVQLTSIGLSKDDARFIFDQTVSVWLNRANKLSLITDFAVNGSTVKFKAERNCISELQALLVSNFKMEVM